MIALGADALADLLLDAADSHDDVGDRLNRMIATPQDNVRRFKTKLAGLKRRRHFVGWRKSRDFAHQLVALLEDIKSGVDDPRAGAEFIAAFYEADEAILNNCDDSNGSIGDVFRLDASVLFARYASHCDDKDWLCDRIVNLYRDNDFGVRDSLIERASEYLPEATMRNLVEQFWELADVEKDECRKRRWVLAIELLARQLKDAPLFEKARRASWGKLSTAAYIDIAQVYFEGGDARTALAWLERIPEGETFQADKRDELLLRVHEQLGQRKKLAEVAWRIFHAYRSEETLADLLSAIGEERRERVIEEEARAILQTQEVSYSAASFLIDVGRMDDAESYLVERAGELNGDFYSSLLPLAQVMEDDGRELAATVIYRALLDSILRRGQSKYYHYGVRYLKRLDALSHGVRNWGDVSDHSTYMSKLREMHGRKSSFWGKYGR